MADKKKHRGSGTHGGGSKKKRRGAGSHGGRGKDGEKHRKLKYMEEGLKPEKGFKRPKAVQKDKKTINLAELDRKTEELLDKGVAEKTEEGVEVNLSEAGYDKLLGSGHVTRTLNVKATDFSEKAKQKLEESGGSAIELS